MLVSQPPTPVIRPVVKRKRLTEAEMTVARGVVDKVEQIQECLEHLMALPPTDLAMGVQTYLRDVRMMPLVEVLRKEVREHLGSQAQKLREQEHDPATGEPVTSRLPSAMTLRQRMMRRLRKRQGRETRGKRKDKSKSGRSKAKRLMPLLKKALKAHRRVSPPNPKRAASSPLPPAASSASSFTGPLSPSAASGAAASASGRADARPRPSRDTNPSAPIAPGRPPPAKSAASGPSAWGSSGRTLSSTARSTLTRTSSPPS